MTYQEAVDFKEKNIAIMGNYSDFLTHRIECLLIAPYDVSVAHITRIYKQAMDGEGNELSLQNLGFFNGDMDVYVIWEPVKGQVEQMRLAAYLAAVAQK